MSSNKFIEGFIEICDEDTSSEPNEKMKIDKTISTTPTSAVSQSGIAQLSEVRTIYYS